MSLNIDSNTPSTSPRRSSHTRAQTQAPPASRSHLSPTPSSKSKQPRAPWRSPSSSSLSVSLSPFRPGLSPPSTTNVQVTKVVAQPELSGEGRVGAAEVAAKAAANSASASLLDIAEGSSRSSIASRSRSGSRSQSVTGSIGRNGMMRRSSRSVLGEGGLHSLEGRLKALDEGVTVSSPEGVAAESEVTSYEGPQRIPTLVLTPSNDLPPEAQQQASTSSISSTSPSQAEKDNNITSHDAAPRSLAAEPISSMTAPPSSLGSQPSISSLTSAPSSLSSPPPPPPSTSSGNSTSWFASFSRSKGKRTVSALSNSSAATSKSAPLPNTTSTPASEVPGATSFAASTDALVVGQMDLEVFNATPEPPAAIPSDQQSLANTPAARRTGDAVDEEFPAVVAITEAFPIPAPIASPVEDKRDVASAPIPEDLSIAAPPVPAGASSTLATSPKKRSWFYSSPKSSCSQSSLVTKPSPLSQPAITAPAIVPPAAEVLPAVSSPSSTLSPPSTTTTLVDSDATIKALSPSKLKAKAKPDLQLVLSTANVVAGPTSIASSIDDVVPSLPSTPNPGQSAQSIISPPVSGKLFTLSLPLLGRTKIPLGVAAGSASDGLRTQDNATTGLAPSTEADTREASNAEAGTTLQDAIKAAATTTTAPDPLFANISSDGSEPLISLDSASNRAGSTDSATEVAPPASTSTISASVSVDSTTHGTSSSSEGSSLANSEATIRQKPTSGGEATNATSWWTYVGWGAGSTSPGSTNGNGIDAADVSSASSPPSSSSPPPQPDSSISATAADAGLSRSRSQVSPASTDNKTSGDQQQQSPSTATVENAIVVGSTDVEGSDNNRKGTETGISEANVEASSAATSSLQAIQSEDAEGVVKSEPTAERGEGAGGVATWLSPWSWYPTNATPTSTVNASQDTVTAAGSGSTSTTAAVAAIAASTPDDSPTTADRLPRRQEGEPERDSHHAGNSDQVGVTTPPPENANVNAETLQGTGAREKEQAEGKEGKDEPVSSSTTSSGANPIEGSIQANRSGWASFFSSRTLMVKTIGYGGDSKKEDEVKRDENGVEVMDIESEDEEGGDKADAPEESAKGDGSALVVATKAISQMLPIASTTSTSPKESTSNDSRLGSKPPSDRHPATPLTQDEKIKEKVKDSVSTKHPNKSPSAPPSPSGTSTPSKGPSKDRNRSGSTPTTPKRNQSPAPSKKSIPPSPPNYVLPTWEDIFHVPPRSVPPPPPTSPAVPPSLPQTASSSPDEGTKTILGKTMKFVSGVLFAKDPPQNHANGSGPSTLSPSKVQRSSGSRPRTSRLGSAINIDGGGSTLDIHALLQQERVKRFERYGEELPKAWSIVDPPPVTPPTPSLRRSLSFEGFLPGSSSVRQVDDVLRGCKRVVIIGVHGWFPGAVMRTMLGEPTGTSSKFANMMEQALHDFEDAHGVQLEKITKIPLEGEGTISRRVEKLYGSLLVNNEWMKDLHEADAVIVATHSQGSVVSTHLLDRLISDHHIRTQVDQVDLAGGDTFPSSVGMTVSPTRKPQRVCCLALCGIHLGPLRYLSSSSLLQPYIQYFESTAARELFEFQSTESAVSKAYVKALRNVLHHGVKMVYVASLNDQVVPIYSGIFTAASHPLILRALYIDGDAYHSSDFLSNLLVLLLRIRNSGIPDGGLLAHLSEATAGSLSGIGHSTAYEEPSTFALAVRYLFEANEGVAPYADLQLDSFDAAHEQNDYEIPWSLRDVIADERVIHFFSKEVSQLRDAFNDWQPKTTILRDLKRKLQPIQRLPSSFSSLHSTSKL